MGERRRIGRCCVRQATVWFTTGRVVRSRVGLILDHHGEWAQTHGQRRQPDPPRPKAPVVPIKAR